MKLHRRRFAPVVEKSLFGWVLGRKVKFYEQVSIFHIKEKLQKSMLL